MVTKGLIMACLALTGATAPITLPIALGTPVSVAVGPVSVSYENRKSLDFDMDVTCFSERCPLFEFSVGQTGSEAYRISV
jgi:hypothetical protein